MHHVQLHTNIMEIGKKSKEKNWVPHEFSPENQAQHPTLYNNLLTSKIKAGESFTYSSILTKSKTIRLLLVLSIFLVPRHSEIRLISIQVSVFYSLKTSGQQGNRKLIKFNFLCSSLDLSFV